MTTLAASSSTEPRTQAGKTVRMDRAILLALIAALGGAGGGNLLSHASSPLTPEEKSAIAKIPAMETKIAELERGQDRRDAKFELLLDRTGRIESSLSQLVTKIDVLARDKER